jgi:transcription initiation factor TFIIIB Brf1 subunit/transcription initiation factor TFIIB
MKNKENKMLVTEVVVDGSGDAVLHAKGCGDVARDKKQLSEKYGAKASVTTWASIEEYADEVWSDIASDNDDDVMETMLRNTNVKPCAAVKDAKPKLTPEERAQRKAERAERRAVRLAKKAEREAKQGGKEMARMTRQVNKEVRHIKKYVTLYASYITEALAKGDLEEAMRWACEMAPLTSIIEEGIEKQIQAQSK